MTAPTSISPNEWLDEALEVRKVRQARQYEILSVRLPTSLLDRVRFRALSGATGRVRYGRMRQITEQALEDWLSRNPLTFHGAIEEYDN